MLYVFEITLNQHKLFYLLAADYSQAHDRFKAHMASNSQIKHNLITTIRNLGELTALAYEEEEEEEEAAYDEEEEFAIDPVHPPMPAVKLKKGDAVCVRTKDGIGYQWVNAIVERVSSNGVHLNTDPGRVSLLLQVEELTKIKTVWADTRKPVSGEN